MTVPWCNNYYKIGWSHTIWVCHSCGNLFDSEICSSFTGECYTCYPRPDRMKGDLTAMKEYEARKEEEEDEPSDN